MKILLMKDDSTEAQNMLQKQRDYCRRMKIPYTVIKSGKREGNFIESLIRRHM